MFWCWNIINTRDLTNGLKKVSSTHAKAVVNFSVYVDLVLSARFT